MPKGRRAALLIALAFLLPTLALVAKFPAYPRIYGVLNDAAHAPVFGSFAVVILALLRDVHGQTMARRYALAFLAALAVGGAIELIQPAIGRGAEFADWWNDALGAVAALAACAWVSSRRSWLAGALCVAAGSAAAWPVGEALLAYGGRSGRYPVLIEPSAPLDGYFIRLRGVDTAVEPLPARWRHELERPALRVRVIGGRWPGVTLTEPEPDWRGHSLLLLDLTNPGPRPITLSLRVHDQAHNNRFDDRFNRNLVLAAETRQRWTVRLEDIERGPTARTLELSQVAGLQLFIGDAAAAMPGEFWVARVWLD